MTGPIWLQIGLGILTLLGLGVSGYATYRTSTRAQQIEGATPSYEALDRRMAAQEARSEEQRKEIDELRMLLDEDRRFIRQLLAERPLGMPLPQPVPSWIPAYPFRPYMPYTAPTPTSIIQPPQRGPIDNP